MKIVYKNWEPDQGLEDHQAKIYTEASGLPATADQIRERNLRRDPKFTRYALTDKGEPLAYVTSRDASSDRGRTYISYPWTLPNCPKKAQTKIFDEQIEYLKKREETTEIATTFVLSSKIIKDQIKYFEKKGFTERDRIYRYILDLEVKDAIKLDVNAKAKSLVSRVATKDDIETLVELCQLDPHIRTAFQSEDEFKDYFENRVLKDGHCVILFDGDEAVAASAPLRFKPNGIYLTGDEEKIVLRFYAIRPGHTYSWNRLISELAKEAKAAGWTDISLRTEFFFRSDSPLAIGMSGMRKEIEEWEVVMVLQDENAA
ncbi:MAG: hypothetical protein ACXADL_02610 [Candidatus Thorarchaeota archaeon]